MPVLSDELTIYTPDDQVTLEEYDLVWLEPWERHRGENTGETTAIGLDVFTSERSFDFWTDRQ